MLYLLILLCILQKEVQTDWLTGPGVLGPVTDWGKSFYQSDSVTYNVQGQISPIATQVDYSKWTKHIIDQDNNISTLNSIVPGDFDNDNDPDLVGAKGTTNTITFYENLGDTFVSKSLFSAPGGVVTIISINYINNDSLVDIVVAGTGGLSWFENSGNFNFIQHKIDSTKDYEFVETGDIDNNGYMDVVSAIGTSSGGTSIKIWKNNGLGNFTNTQTILNTEWRLRFDDLNKDGYLDLIDAVYPGGTYVYFNDGTGNFTQVAFLNSSGVDGMWSRDFNNDGCQDILTGEFSITSDNYIRWWENDGTGINYTPHLV